MIVLWLAAGLLASSPAPAQDVTKTGGGSSFLYSPRHDKGLREELLKQYDLSREEPEADQDVIAAVVEAEKPATAAKVGTNRTKPAPTVGYANTQLADQLKALIIERKLEVFELAALDDEDAVAMLLIVMLAE
jgi:hypothetical protein